MSPWSASVGLLGMGGHRQSSPRPPQPDDPSHRLGGDPDAPPSPRDCLPFHGVPASTSTRAFATQRSRTTRLQPSLCRGVVDKGLSHDGCRARTGRRGGTRRSVRKHGFHATAAAPEERGSLAWATELVAADRSRYVNRERPAVIGTSTVNRDQSNPPGLGPDLLRPNADPL